MYFKYAHCFYVNNTQQYYCVSAIPHVSKHHFQFLLPHLNFNICSVFSILTVCISSVSVLFARLLIGSARSKFSDIAVLLLVEFNEGTFLLDIEWGEMEIYCDWNHICWIMRFLVKCLFRFVFVLFSADRSVWSTTLTLDYNANWEETVRTNTHNFQLYLNREWRQWRQTRTGRAIETDKQWADSLWMCACVMATTSLDHSCIV